MNSLDDILEAVPNEILDSQVDNSEIKKVQKKINMKKELIKNDQK